jgi:RNA polymerase sigma-B factor
MTSNSGRPRQPSEPDRVRRPTGGARSSESEGPRQQDLLRAASAGDQGARERLLQDHLELVEQALRERAGRSLEGGDLFQEGTIGLMGAIDDFEQSGRADFQPYARERIAQQMDAALTEEDAALERAAGLVQAAEAYERAEQAVRRAMGRPGTDEEVARHLKWDVARTIDIKEMVAEARRRHDEEMLAYLDPEDLDPEELRRLIAERDQKN